MTMQELLADLRIDFIEAGQHHHARPGWLQVDCPWCKSVGRYHLGYKLSTGYFNCWRCGGHHVVQVLLELGAKRSEAEAFWKDRSVSPETFLKRKRQGLIEPSQRGKLLRAHRDYLRGRGFEPKEIERIWAIEGIGLASRLAWRIYIPITYREKRVSWTTRAIGEKVTQRYISASAEEEAINHKEVVYGLDNCLHSVVIVEGPTDAWRIGPGAGALFGTAFLPGQIRKLINIPHRVICFDPEKLAQQKAAQLAEELAAFPGTTLNVYLDSEDPGSASPKEIRRLRKLARLT